MQIIITVDFIIHVTVDGYNNTFFDNEIIKITDTGA